MSAARRAAFVIPLVVVGLAMFELTGAWLFSRGLPWWAALAAAVLVFPVAPVAWHVLGERKRKRRLAAALASAKPGVKPKASSLTGVDRFTMRLVAVGLVTLGPLLFFRGGQVWRAFRDHPGWFVPTSPPGPRAFVGDERLFAQVPADAELVLWARRLDGVRGDGARSAPDEPRELLLAARAGGLMFVVRGPDKAFAKLDLADVNRQLAKQTLLPVEGPLVSRRRASDLLVVVSEGWSQAADDRAAGRADGPATIARLLAAAPSDAVAITASAPARAVSGLQLVSMQSWLRASKDAIRVDATFDLADAAATDALVARIADERRELTAAMPDTCRAKVTALLDDVVIVRGETQVRLQAWWPPAAVGDAFLCAVAPLLGTGS